MKYVNESVVFQEIPDEISLAINISNCPCRCPGCHSKYLWNDTGDELTHARLDEMLSKYHGEITCVVIMGGDASVNDVNDIAMYMRNIYPNIKIGWYSGNAISIFLPSDEFGETFSTIFLYSLFDGNSKHLFFAILSFFFTKIRKTE